MTRKLSLTALFALICVLAFYLLKPNTANQEPPSNLPWNIETHADGTSSVFGLHLETTTLRQSLELLGEDHELGLIANQENYAALEVYYSHFSSGPLKGKLILVIDAPISALEEIQDNPAASKYMASGARQFSLNDADLARAQDWPIKSLSFIPAVNLKADVAEQRFGKADQIISEGELTQHLLYPDKGLDIVINEEAKEQLLYVAPRSFAALKDPLLKLNSEAAEPSVAQ